MDESESTANADESFELQAPQRDRRGSAMEIVFVCPWCRNRLTFERRDRSIKCVACARTVRTSGSVVDLVTGQDRAAERSFYDTEYTANASPMPKTMGDLEARWTAPAKPVNRELRRALGPLAKKRVLLLGNGGSTKELAFLAEKPELLVVTDLSVAGIDAICRARDLGPDADRVVFAAVDALDMPIADNSIDVIYASQLVHHLPDRRRFLAEVARVLRPGGRAVFADGASVPVWQAAKRTILGPLFRHSHRRYRRSPEDVRHTREGGFSERELIREIGELGCAPYHFQRVSLLFYLWHRATLVLFPPGLRSLGNSNLIGRPLTDLDRLLSRFSPFRQNQIVLVWGLEKPKAQ